MTSHPRASLDQLERGYRALLLAAHEELIDGVDAERQRVIRRLVRNTLLGALRRAIPHTLRIVGSDTVEAVLSRFLDEEGPRSPLLHAIPGELGAWVHARPELFAHPAVAELVHWETLEVEVLMAPEAARGEPEPAPLPQPTHVVVAHPSARLAAYRHPVHRVGQADTALPQAAPEPVIVVAHRVDDRLRVTPISGAVAKVLVAAAQGATLQDALNALDAASIEAGESPPAHASVFAELAALVSAGALVGFST